jgi:hypothetical protein
MTPYYKLALQKGGPTWEKKFEKKNAPHNFCKQRWK